MRSRRNRVEAGAEIARHEELERRRRWEFPGQARVKHRERGEITVPCQSPLAAIMCAAEAWGCDWAEVLDAEVWRA